MEQSVPTVIHRDFSVTEETNESCSELSFTMFETDPIVVGAIVGAIVGIATQNGIHRNQKKTPPWEKN